VNYFQVFALSEILKLKKNVPELVLIFQVWDFDISAKRRGMPGFPNIPIQTQRKL